MQLTRTRLLLTPEGKAELTIERQCLDHLRLDILREIESAPAVDRPCLSNELSAVEEQMALLQSVVSCARAVGESDVGIGSLVTLADELGEESYTIGGPLAANPLCGCISFDSPLALVLLGASVGDEVDVPSNCGRRRVKVTSVKRGRPGVVHAG